MTRIDDQFQILKQNRQKGFVAYVCVGDPGLEETVDTVLRLEEQGADIIELGVPFSDPLADGRVNQEATARALAAGMTMPGVFRCVEAIRERSQVPLLLFTYANPIYAYGFERAVKSARSAGADGFLLLDLPVEESEEFAGLLNRHKLNNVTLVAPTSTEERIERIARAATGFLYCVSREGVTGAQERLGPAAARLLKKARQATDLPMALGFGISTPDQARAAAQHADAIVVGSAIVSKFHACGNTTEGRRKAARWVGKMIRAVKETS